LRTEQPPQTKFTIFLWGLSEFCFLFFSPRIRVGCDNYRLRQFARSACFNPRTSCRCDYFEQRL